MAKSKKKAAGAAKKPAKRAATARAKPERLTADAKSRLLKAGADANELAAAFSQGWRAVPRKIRVDGSNANKLDALARKYLAAVAKEQALEAKLEARMAPVRDARLRASDALLRTLYKANRVMRAVAVDDPAVTDAFATFDALWAKRAPSADEPTPPEK